MKRNGPYKDKILVLNFKIDDSSFRAFVKNGELMQIEIAMGNNWNLVNEHNKIYTLAKNEVNSRIDKAGTLGGGIG